MEDALVHDFGRVTLKYKEGLNPCFNGRCTRTSIRRHIANLVRVLILVLMEDALVQAINFQS